VYLLGHRGRLLRLRGPPWKVVRIDFFFLLANKYNDSLSPRSGSSALGSETRSFLPLNLGF